MTTARPFIACSWYIDRAVHLPDGSPVVLAEHQRKILDHLLTPVDEALPYVTILWSEPKKSGKSSLAAWIGSWVLNTWGPRAEVLCVGNDFEQSSARIFSEIVRVQQDHPALRQQILKATEKILVLKNGSKAYPVALDATGEAGANPSIVIHDEAWGIVTERARRLFDETTPPPTRPMALRWVSSYAGIPGESLTLEGLCTRGLAGTPIPGLEDCYAAGSLFAFVSHTPRMPWQIGSAGERYYAAQRTELRPSAYLRLHRNEWVAGESIFITEALWDACVHPDISPPLPSHNVTLYGGLDAGLRSDTAAIVTVFWRGDKLRLGPLRIWRPSATEPLDIAGTLETYIHELHTHYHLAAILADPWQMARSCQGLRAAGIPIEEFAQSVPNQTKAGQALFDLLQNKNIELYPHVELRQQALNAVAIESSRGWRLAKERASRKIDSVVALSMAVCAALEDVPPDGITEEELKHLQERAAALTQAAEEVKSVENLAARNEAQRAYAEARRNYVGRLGLWLL